ncbi:MAG: DUF5715 family protein [Bacteroidales bacterium]
MLNKRIKLLIAGVSLLIALFSLGRCACSTPKVVDKKEIKIRHFGNFRKIFNDLNPEHLAAAKKWGVPEVDSREDAEKHRSKLKEIESCDLYKIDKLTHSIPYLVPRAKDLLENIAQSFQDSLASQGVGGYQLIVTSVLRSNADVKKLRRRNGNASANSAHRYGTTIDISYARFNRIESDYPHEIPTEHLKHLLAEVLRDQRKAGKCYVKYEVKQGCFHITVR